MRDERETPPVPTAARETPRGAGAGAASVLAARRPFVLPDGTEIICQTPAEARFFYEDIFERRVYCREGVSLDDAACVFDVGANIGMFSLFVARSRPHAEIYAFEPAPPLYELLLANTSPLPVSMHPFNVGVGEAEGTARLTFYPSSSGMSSFDADREEEEEALRALLATQAAEGRAGMEGVMAHADDLVAERFRSVSFDCPVRPLSAVIREQGVERIDLLKVDVQKSELAVLAGIEAEDWPKVRQVVLEVHDRRGEIRRVRRLLESKGFEVTVEQDKPYSRSVIYNVYGVRRPAARSAGRRRSSGARERARERSQRRRQALSMPRREEG